METWQTILLAIGGNAALLAVLGLLGKSLLDKLIARDTKAFELDLKAKSDAAIEHLRSDLQLATIEHQVRFSRLHDMRATVIAELYGHLVESLWEAESFLSPMEWVGEPNKVEKHRTAMNKLVDLYRYFDKHRIYLPPELCTALESLVREVRSHVVQFGVYVRLQDEILNEGSRWQGLSLSYDIENPINFAFKMIFSGVREFAAPPQVPPCPAVESGGKPPHSITETIETAMRAKVVKSTGIKVE